MMRVTNQTMNDILSRYIVSNRQAVFDLQNQIASGLKVQVASDDPNAYDAINRMKNSDACLQQFARNIEQLSGELASTDGILQEINDVLKRTGELIVSASDSSITPDDRKNTGEEVNQLLEQMLDLANANPEGRYIFGGLRSDAAPYVATRDAAGKITAITYQGNADVRQVEIGKNAYVAANVPGTDLAGGMSVFQSSDTDIFANLIQLRDRLMAGENPVEAEQFTTAAAPNTITVSNTYATGAIVKLETTGTLPPGLQADRYYYVIATGNPNEIQLANTLADARAGNAVAIGGAGTGEHGITQVSLEENTRDQEHILSILGSIGAREERVEINRKILSQWDLDLQSSVNDLEAIDVAEAMTQLSSRKTAYEAALSVTSSMLNVSLLNYL